MAGKFVGESQKIVTGSHDRTLKIWDLRSKACTETKFAGSSCNDLVTTDGAGSTIISGHFDKKIRFWDTRSADSLVNEILLQGKVTSLDLTKGKCNNSKANCAVDSMTKSSLIISISPFHACDRGRINLNKMLNVIFLLQISFFSSTDCHYLAACSRDDTIKIIDLRTNQILTSLSHDNYKVACDFARISFNADSSHVAAGAADGSIFIWNVNGALKTLLKEHT